MKNNKKLGMGLSGLVGNKTRSTEVDQLKKKSFGMGIKSDIHYLPLSSIIPNPNQPRKYFDKKSIEGLSESIADNGVLQPILVKINKEKNKYEIISGERRYLASKKAEIATIACIVKNVEELKSFELAIIENVQRENLSIIEEADSYKKLIKEYSYSHEEVALKVGFSRSRITNALRLLKLPKDIQDLISKNGISYGHARALIKSENQHEIVELILKESLSVRDVEDLVQKKGKYQKDYKDRAVKIPLNPEFVEFFKNNNLVPSLKEKDGKGCLVLKYKDKQDLDDLLSKILNAV